MSTRNRNNVNNSMSYGDLNTTEYYETSPNKTLNSSPSKYRGFVLDPDDQYRFDTLKSFIKYP